MSASNRHGWRALHAALVATALGLTLTAQEPARHGAAVVLDVPALPALDRGLAAADAPRPPRGTGTDEEVLPGSVIVKFKGGGTPCTTAVRAVGGTGLVTPSDADFDLMTIPTSADPMAVAEALSARDDVEYAQPRYRVHAMLTPNDPFFNLQWHFSAIDMEKAWDIN